MKNNKRVESLDWLRGLMALSIMIYHYIGKLFFEPDASTLLGRLGIYGVSIFFILSGLSMAIVYNKYIKNIKTALYFLIRRIFRIWPLLWVVIFIVLFYSIAFHKSTYSVSVIVLNLTTLFGFVKPGAYMTTGAWSIGNEMVYYALTPLIIVLYNRKKIFGNLILLFTVFVGFYYSEFVLMPTDSLVNQWLIYINPFNNLFLYVSGIAIFYNLKEVKIDVQINVLILIISGILFVLIPFEGDQIIITTGIGRIVFSALSILIVIAIYKTNFKLPKIIKYKLEHLGIATYSIYMLHPIMLPLSNKFFAILLNLANPVLQFILAITSTIIVSLVSYRYYETPFINLGKKITSVTSYSSNNNAA